MKWPRKNDAESIGERREAIRSVVGDRPLSHEDESWPRAQYGAASLDDAER